MAGKFWLQEFKPVGNIASAVRNGERYMLVLSSLSRLSSASTPVQGMTLLIFRVAFPSQSSSSIPQRYAWSSESIGNLNPMHLAIRSHYLGTRALRALSARLGAPHWTAEEAADGGTSAISREQASLGLLLPLLLRYLRICPPFSEFSRLTWEP